LFETIAITTIAKIIEAKLKTIFFEPNLNDFVEVILDVGESETFAVSLNSLLTSSNFSTSWGLYSACICGSSRFLL
jgi:hypothetical protein